MEDMLGIEISERLILSWLLSPMLLSPILRGEFIGSLGFRRLISAFGGLLYVASRLFIRRNRVNACGHHLFHPTLIEIARYGRNAIVAPPRQAA